MRNKKWYAGSLSLIGMAVLAAVLAGTALGSSAARNQTTKTLQLASGASDVDYIDPALAYGVLSWNIETETCAFLVHYSDEGGKAATELTPDAATGMPVISKDGKTYTFTIKSGIKFSNGTTLTAQSFVDAMNRDANPSMNSPVNAFMSTVVGWDDVVNKKATKISGVSAKGNKLIIKLNKPDGGLINKLAMPFFCAIDLKNTPVDPQGVNTLPGAGPYYVASRTVGKQLVLKTNPNYKGNRPHRSETMVITMNTNLQQTYLQIQDGTYATDLNNLGVPSAAKDLADKYGINKARFFVHSSPETDYIALNTAGNAFSNVATRRAANFAIDRPALLRVRGYLGGHRTTTILPQSLTGGVYNQKLYPIAGANLAKAKAVLGSNSCGNVNFWYAAGTVGTPQAGIAKYNLEQLGCKVTSKPFQGYAIYTAAGVKGTEMDAMFAGWYQDYSDGYDFFHILLDGRTIQAANNNNLAYFNNAQVNAKIDAADKLSGAARAKAWGALDIFTMQNFAPWAPIDNRNVRDFVGPNVKGYLFQPPWGAMNLGSLYLS